LHAEAGGNVRATRSDEGRQGEGVSSVLGRLPKKYQLTIWVAGLLTFTALGTWLVLRTGLPMVWPSGAAVGAVLGVISVAVFLVAIGRADAAPRPVKAQSRSTTSAR
jgi:hypothetical protein